MKKRGILFYFSILMIVLAIASILPTIKLYLSPEPKLFSTNDMVIEKLKKNDGTAFSFIVMSDCHAGLIFDDSAFLKQIGRINREGRFRKTNLDFVAIAGDVSFRGSAWDYSIFNRLRALIRWPVVCAIGNHDDNDDKGGLSRFKKYVGRMEFSFGNRNSYFIFIDNSSGDLTEKQFKKLEDELKISQAFAHRFVILHKPAISPYQQSWYRPELNPWSQRFMKLCEQYKVDIVFTGHEHMFKELVHGGVRYVTAGGGGIITQHPKRDGGFLHYLVVRVYGDYVDYEVRETFPPLWEFFCYYMWKDIFYFLRDVLI